MCVSVCVRFFLFEWNKTRDEKVGKSITEEHVSSCTFKEVNYKLNHTLCDISACSNISSAPIISCYTHTHIHTYMHAYWINSLKSWLAVVSSHKRSAADLYLHFQLPQIFSEQLHDSVHFCSCLCSSVFLCVWSSTSAERSWQAHYHRSSLKQIR